MSAVLAYNANVATMKAAIEGMCCFRDLPRRVVATCSATAAAGTSFTVALSNVDDPDAVFRRSGEVLQMLTKDTDAMTVLTTPGRSGFTSGTYDLTVVGLRHRDVNQFKQTLVSQDA